MLRLVITAGLLLPLFAACSHTPTMRGALEPFTYKIDIQQGNVVTQEMVAKLRQGMTEVQVRYVMGSPLVTDPFHPNRWDYVYLYEKSHKVTENRRLTVIFADGKLDHLEGAVQLQDSLSDHPSASPAMVGSVTAPPSTTSAPTSTPSATASTPPSTDADASDPAVAQSEAKPKQPSFFSRVLEKIGL